MTKKSVQKCKDNEHKYKTAYEDWDKEVRECEKCGDRYTLYDDEMK